MYGRNGEAPVPIVAPSDPGRLLRRGAGGGPDRADVPHAGLPALRRLPGQRLRAVADPRTSTNCPTCGCSSRPDPTTSGRRHRGLLAVQARPADPGPPVGRARAPRASNTASAASRSRTAPATSPTTRPTTTSWCAPARPRSTASRSRPGGRRPGRDAADAGAGLGIDVRADHGRRTPSPRAPGEHDRAGASAPPQPVPAESRRGAAALRQGRRPGDEPRPAGHAAAGQVPRRRTESTPRSTACRSRPSSSRTALKEAIDA